MAAKKATRTRTTRTQSGKSSRSSHDAPTKQTADPDDLKLVKYEYEIWSSDKKPDWHPIRKMRYVFWRMIAGVTVTDAVRELHWHEGEFWNLVDLKRHAPFREEYKRAKTLQGRAFSDSIVTIAEGRDKISRKEKRRVTKIIERAMKRVAKQKTGLAARAIVAEMMGDLREHDKIVMSRNKLQMEAAKWIAKTSNPSEFGEKSSVALGGMSPDGDGANLTPRPIAVQFIGPDGKVVPL